MSECYILPVLGSRIEEVDFSHRLLSDQLIAITTRLQEIEKRQITA